MYLFINSSKNIVDVMLFNETKLIDYKSIKSNNNHTIVLYECLNKLNIDYKLIERVYIVTGPGSYTGLRIGMIFAKTLALTYSVEIYPVKLSAIYDELKMNCAIDLRGNKYYYQQQIVENLNSNINIDLELDLKMLYESKLLLNIKPINVYEVEIFYAKTAI